MLTKQPNRIAQQALTDCQILVADFRELEKLYDKFHDLERLGRKIAEFYFLEKEQKEIEMALLDADKKYLIMREKFPDLESVIPQYYIASYLGISATQLSRIRKE
ncbi:Crp/Fnr family transcriptional regulator [Olleya sp. R77988]|uniref:Crp/Fnr family transcriptional regulator n=1 Tax=Olleya sp. R77988 TaxID=3093875 RepID=UPI0037CA5DC6